VLAVAPQGKLLADAVDLLGALSNKSADLAVISDDAQVLSYGRMALRLPGDLPEWATPLVGIVPAQLFCYHLTRVRGLDPEAPRGLTKVTETL
jgi:glucosamine--fructose-6-phosphate aminotransferase (isomerizing)